MQSLPRTEQVAKNSRRSASGRGCTTNPSGRPGTSGWTGVGIVGKALPGVTIARASVGFNHSGEFIAPNGRVYKSKALYLEARKALRG